VKLQLTFQQLTLHDYKSTATNRTVTEELLPAEREMEPHGITRDTPLEDG